MLVEIRDITQIRPYDNNPRLNDEAVDAVAASIREFGFRQPIVVDEAGERPSAPDASGVRRRTTSERETDWLKNLEHDPHARVRIAGAELPAVYEPSADPTADLRRAVDLLREKYGSEWVADWYLEMGRIPVKLRLA